MVKYLFFIFVGGNARSPYLVKRWNMKKSSDLSGRSQIINNCQFINILTIAIIYEAQTVTTPNEGLLDLLKTQLVKVTRCPLLLSVSGLRPVL